MTSRTPGAAPGRQRNALAPGIIGAAALLAGIPLIGGEFATIICYIVAILALIIGWFAIQARHWWWAPIMLAIAVLWNPVYPFGFAGPWWIGAHVAAAATLIAAGATIWVPRAAPSAPARGS